MIVYIFFIIGTIREDFGEEPFRPHDNNGTYTL